MDTQSISNEPLKNEVEQPLNQDLNGQESKENLSTEAETKETEDTIVEPEKSKAEESNEKSFTQMTIEEVISEMTDIIEKPVEEIKDTMLRLKQHFYNLRKAEIEAEKKAYEESESEEPFEPTKNDNEEKLKNLLQIFKDKKAEYIENIEKVRAANLESKQAIIEELKAIADDTDNINKHYTKFQQLQQDFKAVGDVPATATTELWKSFQNIVERIYDLLKINKDLREYDFKKNLEIKTQLCSEAEALAASDEDVISIFKKLQTLHDQWREAGPVAKELREELWNKFKNASSEINKKYQTYFESRKEAEKQNEIAKEELCVKLESINVDELKSYSAWDAKTKEIIGLQEEWKKLGFAARKVNNLLFARFRKGCDSFFEKKAQFYKTVKDELSENLNKKTALCERAEALKDSTDWKKTTDEFIALQKEWKTIGLVSKKYSDAIWNRFVTACDAFFEEKNKQVSSVRNTEHANLKAKKEIIAKIKAIPEDMEREEAVTLTKSYIKEWNEAGHVPFKEKDKIYKEYQGALDEVFGKYNFKEQRARFANFKNAVSEMATEQDKLNRERNNLLRQYDAKKSELQTYENNLGFLTTKSKSGSGLLKEMERKMQKIKDELALIQEKIEVIDQNAE